MRAYRISIEGSESQPNFVATRSEAAEAAKAISKAFWPEVFIDLVQFEVDQKTVCQILSGNGCAMTVLASWTLTNRGGLKEVPVEEGTP